MAAEPGLEYLLSNSPFGCLEEMIADLSELKNIDKNDPAFRNGIRKHWGKTMHILESSDGHKVIISNKNLIRIEEDGTGVYGDSITKKEYRVSFSERKLVDCTDSGDSIEGKRQELVDLISTVLKKYLEEFFSKGFWNSEWTLDLDSNKVSGGVYLFAYLFEESNNLFFKDERTESIEVDAKNGSAKEIAEEAITGIMDVERKLVKRLHQHFEEEAEETFKVLRLALPITQSQLDWDANLAKVYSQLQGGKK